MRKHRLHKVQNDVRIGRAENFQNVVVRYRIARIRGAHIRNRKTVAHAALGRSCDKVYRFFRILFADVVENAFQIVRNIFHRKQFEVKAHAP